MEERDSLGGLFNATVPKERRYENVDWIQLAEYRFSVGGGESYEHGNNISGS
jgi:hypothetical protein